MPTKPEEFVFHEEVPVRIDRFLAHQFSRISRAYLQGLISEGNVTVDGDTARKGQLLRKGQVLRVGSFLLPEERRISPNPKIHVPIVHVSDELLVVEKPAGLPTHPNDFDDRRTLANALLASYPEIENVGDDRLRPGIVHRLDTDTSGLLMVARSQEMFRYLRKRFDQREVKKTYHALVLGRMEKEGEIDEPVAHHPRNPRKMVVIKAVKNYRSKPRNAKTIFRPLKVCGDLTLLEVRTLTGRMHQIRVHMSYLGHPLVGDRLYQTPRSRNLDRSNLSRHFLHASTIEVLLPYAESNQVFTSSLPQELKRVLAEKGFQT